MTANLSKAAPALLEIAKEAIKTRRRQASQQREWSRKALWAKTREQANSRAAALDKEADQWVAVVLQAEAPDGPAPDVATARLRLANAICPCSHCEEWRNELRAYIMRQEAGDLTGAKV